MKRISLIFLLLLSISVVNAQYLKKDTTFVKPSYKFSFTPHYLIYNGIRLDFEKEFKEKNWYVISPTFYLGRNSDFDESKITDDNYYKNLYGAGLGFYYKHILGNSLIVNAYFSAGARFNYFYIDYYNYQWITTVEDGNEIINYELQEINEQIFRLDGNLTLGLETEFYQRLYMDTYFGLALRYSYPYISKDGITSEKFDDFMWRYGYTGAAIVLGVKFGINNKKY